MSVKTLIVIGVVSFIGSRFSDNKKKAFKNGIKDGINTGSFKHTIVKTIAETIKNIEIL